MTSNCFNRENIGRFFDEIGYKEPAFGADTLALLALRIDDVFCILQGSMTLDTGVPRKSVLVRTENLLGAVYSLSEVHLTPRELVADLLEGELRIAEDTLQFRPNENGNLSALYDPFRPAGQAQIRFESLSILGGSVELRERQAAIDWELRAASTPFSDLQELANELLIGPVSEKIRFDIVAHAVALIDGNASTIEGTKGQVVVRLARGLDQSKLTLSYRAMLQGKVVERKLLPKSALDWHDFDGYQQGVAHIVVQSSSVLQCFVSYAGRAQAFYWIADPTTFANARRAVYELADPKLEILSEFLTRGPEKRRDARDLEAGVAWLLWMMGFSVAHLGATARTQEMIDLVATTPSGHLALIECTTGLLSADKKLARLAERTEAVRQRLVDSGNRHLRVLPVIVTSMTRAQVAAEIEAAERHKVLLMTRENLEQAPMRTLAPQNADLMFTQAEQEVQAAFDRLQAA